MAVQSITPIPAGIEIAAATIVERLLEQGANLSIDFNAEPEGRLWACFPEPGIGAREDQTELWAQGNTDGAYRELWTLIKVTPYLKDAVKEYICRYPRDACDGRVYA